VKLLLPLPGKGLILDFDSLVSETSSSKDKSMNWNSGTTKEIGFTQWVLT